MKHSFFQAAVTSILLYGCTTWTLTKWLEKKLDGNYTRMLRAILNKSWRQHPTRHQLYGHLPPITKTIQVRRTRHAGHCWRSRDELIRDVLLWTPTHGRAKAGRPALTYIQQLCEDTGCCPEDLPRAMNDREEWRERVRDIRATSATWWWWCIHYFKAFDSIDRGKKWSKFYFDIVAGVLHGDTLAPHLFITCLDYVLRTSIDKIKENGFKLTKERSTRYPTQTITDADYTDDIALLANAPAQAETLLHSLEQAAAGKGLHVNAYKMEYMSFNQKGNISTLNGSFLKQVDKFTYLGSSVSSTKRDINTRLTKAWTAIDRLSVIWKSDVTNKIKRSFFQATVVSILLYGCTTWTLTKHMEKKLDSNYTRMLRAILNKWWRQRPTKQ